jgi:hypothetical protein
MIVLSEEDLTVIKESLNRELNVLKAKIRIVESEIRDFEKKYEMSSEEFLERFDKGELGDSQDFFEWWGLLKGLERLKKEIERVRRVLSYC